MYFEGFSKTEHRICFQVPFVDFELSHSRYIAELNVSKLTWFSGFQLAPLPPLTLDSVSTHFFSLHDLSIQLSKNSFNVESCCTPLFPEDNRAFSGIVFIGACSSDQILHCEVCTSLQLPILLDISGR